MLTKITKTDYFIHHAVHRVALTFERGGNGEKKRTIPSVAAENASLPVVADGIVNHCRAPAGRLRRVRGGGSVDVGVGVGSGDIFLHTHLFVRVRAFTNVHICVSVHAGRSLMRSDACLDLWRLRNHCEFIQTHVERKCEGDRYKHIKMEIGRRNAKILVGWEKWGLLEKVPK